MWSCLRLRHVDDVALVGAALDVDGMHGCGILGEYPHPQRDGPGWHYRILSRYRDESDITLLRSRLRYVEHHATYHDGIGAACERVDVYERNLQPGPEKPILWEAQPVLGETLLLEYLRNRM